MGYQKHNQNSRDISNNYRKGKTKKTISTDNGKLILKFQEMNYQHLNQRLLKSMKEISLELKIKYFSYIEDQILFLYSKECLL